MSYFNPALQSSFCETLRQTYVKWNVDSSKCIVLQAVGESWIEYHSTRCFIEDCIIRLKSHSFLHFCGTGISKSKNYQYIEINIGLKY